MADTPELDQVAEMRRKIAAHAELPRAYWVVFAAVCVLIAGIPIWSSFLPGADAYLRWGLLAVALGSAAYAVVRRRRSGVYLPRRVFAYPSARGLWVAVMAGTAAGFVGVYILVDLGQLGIALAALVPVAVLASVGQIRIRTVMRRDLEAGRVNP
ncbi:hypothetical protein [Allonocardiopsis opalescens]|uniref:Transmembrane protein n=1 Tax=Allonocardiopsis opalescens TaxID=1144618 RepID=A0A2T0QAK8_9ACTN|nr:hypothetical protein [Allonocardiopsis opalescens]PRY00841.1 hypothetical protein CLV72_102473 [Allonocardiopsis opalescens]